MFERSPRLPMNFALAAFVGATSLVGCASREPELVPVCASTVKLMVPDHYRGGQVVLRRPDHDPALRDVDTCVYLNDARGEPHLFSEGVLVTVACPRPDLKLGEMLLTAKFGGDGEPVYTVDYTAQVSNPADVARLTAHCPTSYATMPPSTPVRN